LADTKDLTAYIRKSEHKNKTIHTVEEYIRLENFLLPIVKQEENTYSLKELNEKAESEGLVQVSPLKIKTIINFWAIKNWIKSHSHDFSKNHFTISSLLSKDELENKAEKRHELAMFIVNCLYEKITAGNVAAEDGKEEVLVEFSVHELKHLYETSQNLFKYNIEIVDIEDALFYLSKINALNIEGGFLIVYNRLTIDRLEQNNKIQYKADDYQKLNQFYENKIQQIHIVGEYAKKMISDYRDALQFAEDYFQLNYASFLNKYFKGSRQNEIKRNLTPTKFKQLFGELSPAQLRIINDNETKHIVVTAGPGSGKNPGFGS
jgi:ATP-dependent DNA helicase RecQ